jgi:hypothetical protein
MLKQFGYMILMSAIFALLEIQVEGKDGWCKNLPTFRINVFFKKILGGKPLTGYHLYMIIFMVLVFHGLFSLEMYTYITSLKAIGLLSYFFVLEDFLWFVFNPHYTVRKFGKPYVEWHKRWVWGLPLTYWWGMIIGTFLLVSSYLVK